MRAILFKLIHSLVTRFPRSVVAVSLMLAVLAGFYGTAEMEMITDQDRLLSEDLEYHHRYMEFLRRFGDLEFLYILIEGPTQESMISFAEDLAERLRQSQDVKEVIDSFDTSWAVDYALYFDEFSTDDLQKLQNELDVDPDAVDDLFSIRSIDSILLEMSQSLDAALQDSSNKEENEEREIEPLIAALEGKEDERLVEFSRLKVELDTARQIEKEYNWTSGGKSLLMLVLPAKDYSTLSVIEAPLKRVRTDIWLTKQDHPGVDAGVTGRPALQADEMRTTNDDMMMASITALICVTVLFSIFFRELGRPLCGVVTLLCAMGWTYGFVALSLGHLNLLSLVFALVLIGLGIDFGIHFLHRYQEELNKQGDSSHAVSGALLHVGSGILTGALTSSVAFLLALTTDFLGLAELGYVAGIGILFCLIAMLVSLSAMLIVYDRHVRKNAHPPTPVHLLGLRHVSRYPLVTVIVILIATAALLPKAFQVRFDDNLLNLQADGLESVEYEHKLLNESEHSTWYCAFLEPDLDAVRETVTRLEKNPTVAKTESLADALPSIDSKKRELIQSLRESLGPLHTKKSEPYFPNSHIYKTLIRKLDSFFAQLKQLEEYQARMAEMPDGMKPMSNNSAARNTMIEDSQLENSQLTPEQIAQMQAQQQAIAKMPVIDEQQKALFERLKKLVPLLSNDEKTVIARLEKANELLLERPRSALSSLAEIIYTEPPTLDDVSSQLKTLFTGDDGSLLVMAYPKENIWQTEPMREFVSEMRKIDPEVTGTPIQVYESSMLMRDSFYRIGTYSVLVVAVLVFLDFLSLRALFFVMTPLLLGVLWLVEIMGAFGVSLNLANFFAIPILIGIGVDNAVHFYHRYEERFDVEYSMYTTGTTLTLTTMTTMVGFGSLIFASHKGLASLGMLMAMGSATCWFACVVFMPTLIQLLSRRLPKHHEN